ncbi:hypothetical protein PsorP6_013060 [Peronosclerospora sorghi]|uniref:Uncharacterized protein n=1 Tax=Peronosclerospora sorghi TaxID=230839 RepID=A0ACC0WJD0_9STRA|nr:hypothetical protein PsorP6_013060 [Peronosclerospora sorghi]
MSQRHGGFDAVLDVPEALESPKALERRMEDKIRRAFTKLSARFGSPNQMRITTVALLTEVVHFTVRNEDVFLTAR